MKITRLVWDDENVGHIARHSVTPQEVEAACFSKPLVFRSKKGRYLVLGRTEAGRCLLVVVRYVGRGRGRVVTARDMTKSERRRFERGR